MSLQNTWEFYNPCGSNIRLSNGERTATVKVETEMNNRVVISKEPMLPNQKYQIEVKKKADNKECTAFGICLEDPNRIKLPQTYNQFKNFVGVIPLGTCTKINVTMPGTFDNIDNPSIIMVESLPTLHPSTINGSNRLGVMVKAENESHFLYVFLDKNRIGPLAEIKADDYFAVFDLQASLEVSIVDTPE